MNKTMIAYVAGLFDGEGSVFLIHQRSPTINDPEHRVHRMGVNITNTDEAVIRWVSDNFPFGKYRSKKIYGSVSQYKQIYVWEAFGPRAKDFLELLLPYLICKKERAELAIGFQKRLSSLYKIHNRDVSWVIPICDRIHKLNCVSGRRRNYNNCYKVHADY